MYEVQVYKPRRAYEFDVDTQEIIGRFLFIIGGEMADGMKCWYKCNEDGEILSGEWYSMTRKCGKMIAIMEGE